MVNQSSDHYSVTEHQTAKFEIKEGPWALGVPSHQLLQARDVHLLNPLHGLVEDVGPGLAVV